MTLRSFIETPFALNKGITGHYVGTGTTFTNAFLFVPKGTKEKYQNTDGWKEIYNIIEM